MRIDEIIERIGRADKLFIYGAGLMGKALKKCLTEPPYNKVISCFIVENMSDNPNAIGDTPIKDVASVLAYKDEIVLVALHEKHIFGAIEMLCDYGFSNVIPVSFDSDLWSIIRGNWFESNVLNNTFTCDKVNENDFSDLSVFVVHSIYDKELSEQRKLREFELPIQVGAALTDKELFALRDNCGDNISKKNKQYCELTALYWMWKNDTSKYIGLSHYRRLFELEGEQIVNALQNGVDVLVTVPVLNFDGVKVQYCRDHDKQDWDIMMEAIRELYPEYLSSAELAQSGIYYYAYNMFITRKEIFDDYCKWLFDILEYCEERIGLKADNYQNRYIGFLAERLLTIFLTYNGQYKVAIAPKHFIESA